MSPEEAYAAAVDASGAGVSAIFVTGDPAQMLRAALASLRVSGYVVVPVSPTLGMLGAAATAWRADPERRSSTILKAAVSAAPAFPPEADHG